MAELRAHRPVTAREIAGWLAPLGPVTPDAVKETGLDKFINGPHGPASDNAVPSGWPQGQWLRDFAGLVKQCDSLEVDLTAARDAAEKYPAGDVMADVMREIADRLDSL